MHILGLSCFYHDAAAALLSNGELIAAAEEERFSRKKHDFGFPTQAIRFCLQQGGIRVEDLDYVVFYEKPFDKFERILMTSLQTYPRSLKVFRESMVTWLMDKLWVRHHIEQELGLPKEKVLFTQHHLAHAASAFLASPYEEAAILTVDGVGEWATATYGVGKGTGIRLEKEIRFPHSLGLLYSAFTAFLGFEVNEGEYKVMGMAPYGQPRYVDKVWKLIQQFDDGSFALDMDYFTFHHSTTRTYSRKFEALFGAPRPPETHFFTEGTGFPSYFGAKPGNYDELCRSNQHYADLAASIQKVTEEVLVRMASCLRRQTGMRALCLAGGVGLNSVANGRILRESGFEKLWVQPAAGDSGGALGAALHVYHTVLGKPRRLVMQHAYWGQEYGNQEIEAFLQGEHIAYEKVPQESTLIDRTVDALTRGKVVGWYQGRFEWGPRALGNRSILADPRRAEMKDIVNTKIKFREPYRPFAPSVLAERAEEYFDLPDARTQDPARFMLLVAPVCPEKHETIPAVTHVDGTGRLQTVFSQTNPRYHRLIEQFGQATGVPVLMNTSYNLRGEPIVTTPQNAYSTFARSELDLLVAGDCLVAKKVA
ncbi:MAG: carbamoyltransferase [Candidatus Latescibacteria bacterium]|nr:carbamoyltransferase [Candidatus Latescibacterota bacterium]